MTSPDANGDVLARLKKYAERVDGALLTSLADVEPGTLRDAVAHYPRAGGKRLRPVVALLACEAAGGRVEDAIPAAVAAELVHDFSLVHDDIMDEDDLRRGKPTVHAEWGMPMGILAGDALLAKAFEVVADHGAPPHVVQRVLLDMATTTRELCAGQALDMGFETRDDVTVDAYVRMIDGKTASLYAFAARAGALLGLAASGKFTPDALWNDPGPEEAAALATWGREFGLAFQVRDDVLDVVASTKDLGKTAGKDVRSGKKTVLLLTALARAEGADADALRRVVGDADASPEDVARVVDAYRSTGALADAEARTRAHAEKAVTALDALPDSPAKALLADLAWWSATRDA